MPVIKLTRSGFDMLNKQQLLNHLTDITQDKSLMEQYPCAYNFLMKNIQYCIKRVDNHSS